MRSPCPARLRPAHRDEGCGPGGVKAVAADLLRRPEVAFKTMADRTTRHIVNRAQIDHAVASTDVAREKAEAGRIAMEKVVPSGLASARSPALNRPGFRPR